MAGVARTKKEDGRVLFRSDCPCETEWRCVSNRVKVFNARPNQRMGHEREGERARVRMLEFDGFISASGIIRA